MDLLFPSRTTIMQNKLELELFFNLPPEMQLEAAQHLPTPDVLNYALISNQHLTLFTPILNIRKFLHYATRGRYDIVKAMLTDNIKLIVAQGIVTDCSGRTFENISAFEYTLWAKDKPMWTVMLDCISQSEETSKVIAKLISQYKNVKENGVTYCLKGKQVTECHCDFENTIIKELETQVGFLNEDEVNWGAADKQWVNGVGGAQNLCPMHVVYEYCSTRPFYPLPDFTKPFASMPTQQFYNWEISKNENWFAGGSKLGVDFAIVKGTALCLAVVCRPGRLGAWCSRVLFDLAAVKALCEVRTKDFINLESQLEALAIVDNQPKPTPHS